MANRSAPTRKRGASYTCSVLPGAAFVARAGANLGDPLGPADELCPGDIYRLAEGSESLQLAIADPEIAPEGAAGAWPVLHPGRTHQVAPGSEVGGAGAPLALDARLTFLAPDGHSIDAILMEVGGGRGTLVLPLGPFEPGADYALAGVAAPEPVRLADLVAFGFVAGTRITMADGHQRAVEGLMAGDRILTRDHGPQPIVAVLRRTERALGPRAPIVISAETLGNPGDLILSPHQRLLVYQRGTDRLIETAEMLVRAGHLVDDDRIYARRGGFVDYVSLVLARHEILYAECVAVESLEVSAATLPRLPEDQAQAVAGLEHRPHFGTEAGRETARAARARLLRRTE